MNRSLRILTALLILAVGAGPTPLRALSIELDYRFDSTGYFTANPDARTALERAATDLGDFLLPGLAAVPAAGFTGQVGGRSVTIDWTVTVLPPGGGAAVPVPDFALPADGLRVFVGAANLGAETLGVGGPGGLGLSVQGSGPAGDFTSATAAAAGQFNAVMPRGGGPVIAELLLDDPSLTSVPLTLRTGSFGGSLTMNSAADWHFDVHSAPASDAFDFYSVALHELLHVLGIGSGLSWNEGVLGLEWTGPAVAALVGAGAEVIDADGSHIAEGFTGVSLATGAAQSPVMEPSIGAGMRRTLTDLDAAFLRDLGYHVVPEPNAIALLALAALAGWGTLRRRR